MFYKNFRNTLVKATALSAVCVLLGLSPVIAQDGDGASHDTAASPDMSEQERQYLQGTNAAMDKMMADMHVPPTGDIDRDFVLMMIPHHQGAIEMAELLLRYGNNQKLKYIAQEIVITQQQEIGAMLLAIGEPLPDTAAPTSPPPEPSGSGTSAMPSPKPSEENAGGGMMNNGMMPMAPGGSDDGGMMNNGMMPMSPGGSNEGGMMMPSSPDNSTNGGMMPMAPDGTMNDGATNDGTTTSPTAPTQN